MTIAPISSLKFGTSGLRGLAVDLEGQAARRYVTAFLRHLGSREQLGCGKVFIGRDFRPSSPAILHDCAAAIAAAGLEPIDCGTLPTPALASHAMAQNGAAVMITGSHIPADRNGLKFYLPLGEIGKDDEAGILAALDDAVVPDAALPAADETAAARRRYLERCAGLIGEGALKGRRIGSFEHSTVARDIVAEALERAGAEVIRLGRVEGFVAVDTEAFDDAVFAPLAGWAAEYRLDALVSADGDGDRPLLMDERGQFVRGDVLGLLTARYLNADVVVTPVTSNSAIEGSGFFPKVERTKVGSPFVVAAMEAAKAAGAQRIVGFEANGGTLTGTDIAIGGQVIDALPTRDAMLPILAVLGLAAGRDMPISTVVAELPLRHAVAGRIADVPSQKSGEFLGRLAGGGRYAQDFFAPQGRIDGLVEIDGLQFRLGEDIVHFRASGNAPELRCYVEGATPERARALLDWALARARKAVE